MRSLLFSFANLAQKDISTRNILMNSMLGYMKSGRGERGEGRGGVGCGVVGCGGAERDAVVELNVSKKNKT